MTISLEKIFFAYILNNKKYFPIVEAGYFKNAEIKFVYDIIRKYMVQNIEINIPTPKQVLEMVSLEDKEGIITKEILKAILTTNLNDYDESNFIVPKLNAWILSNKIKNGTIDIIEETRSLDTITDFEQAILSANKIKNIVEEMSSTSFVHDENLGSDFDDPEMHVQDSSRFKVRTGFETIDHMLGGGWDIGTLNVIMAQTNGGKCTLSSTEISIRNKGNIKEEKIEISSIFTKISKGDYNI
jgi:hypothetical protein